MLVRIIVGGFLFKIYTQHHITMTGSFEVSASGREVYIWMRLKLTRKLIAYFVEANIFLAVLSFEDNRNITIVSNS